MTGFMLIIFCRQNFAEKLENIAFVGYDKLSDNISEPKMFAGGMLYA